MNDDQQTRCYEPQFQSFDYLYQEEMCDTPTLPTFQEFDEYIITSQSQHRNAMVIYGM